MAGETKTLAEFATALRYEDIPAPAVAIAKACIIDTVGVVLFGSTLPWSKIVADYVHHTGNGASTVLGSAFRRASAPGAAFANGAFAHSFEFDTPHTPALLFEIIELFWKEGRGFVVCFVSKTSPQLLAHAAQFGLRTQLH